MLHQIRDTILDAEKDPIAVFEPMQGKGPLDPTFLCGAQVYDDQNWQPSSSASSSSCECLGALTFAFEDFLTSQTK